MRRDLIAAAVAVVVFTVLLGVVYPLVMTGVGQLAFSSRRPQPDRARRQDRRLVADRPGLPPAGPRQ